MPLCPYGSPPVEIAMQPGLRMKDWSGSDAAWTDFYDRLIRDISEAIWPVWRPGSGWTGAAAAFHEDATRAELEILVADVIQPDVLSRVPAHTRASPLLPERDHFWLYAIEDDVRHRLRDFAVSHGPRYRWPTQAEIDVAAFGLGTIAYYDHDLLDQRPLTAFRAMFANKYEGLYQTKLDFRRPRPHAAAHALGVAGFRHRQALSSVHTGNHPSLVSGHCLQGLLMPCTLLEQGLADGVMPDEQTLAAYRQFAADFGDRRVFAGVHFITDNVASWITALRVIPWVFPENPKAHLDFVVAAITQHSAVYRIAAAAFPRVETLRPAWTLLSQELTLAGAPGH